MPSVMTVRRHKADLWLLQILVVCCTTTVGVLRLFSCRGSALVELHVENEVQLSLVPAHTAWLEVWTDDEPLSVSASCHQQLAAMHNQTLGQLHISIQAVPVVNPGKMCHGCDLIIGKLGMLKLGLGIDAKTGCICNVKHAMQK